MQQKNNLLPFIIGAAVGAAIGYLLASGKGKELLADLKESAGKIKEDLENKFNQGKEMIDDLGAFTDDNA